MHILDTDLFSLTDRTNNHESQRLRFRLSNLAEDDLWRQRSSHLKNKRVAGFPGCPKHVRWSNK